MSEQLDLRQHNPLFCDEFTDDRLCEHCGKAHTLEGPYCSEACSHRARHDPDEHRLVDYEPACDRDEDRGDCRHYNVCLSYACRDNQARVCTGCVTGYEPERGRVTLMRSNACMLVV